MKKQGVKELAELSGISVRTLHHYDKIGLLKPAERTEAGYRLYGERELLRLQQILFYKELDFPLKAIKEMLDDPGFKLVEALESHRTALYVRKERFAELLRTIDRTISHIKTGKIMTKPELLYKGLPKEIGTTYREEAIQTYGKDAIEQSENALLKMGKEGFENLKAESEKIYSKLFTMMHEDPVSAEVQEWIARHYQSIRQFWGTSQLEDRQAEAYAGLGNLYVSDERFTKVDGVPQPEFAKFLQKAMRFFADTSLAD